MATILVVDDQELNRSVLTTLLGHHGHRLVEATTGVEALSKVCLEGPQLVVTDILMPTMDGYEFVRRLRKLETIKQPKVIFYSATYLEKEARTLARACGVSSVICKPTDPDQILKIIDSVLLSEPSELPTDADGKAEEGEVSRILSRKLYEKVQEVEELNARLERRVAERTAALESANRSLQQEILERKKAEEEVERSHDERLRLKSEFLSHVSHELRSPLSVAHQFTTILLDGLGGSLSPEQQEYLEIMLRNLNQLKGMINDLLEASRADVGKLAVRLSSLALEGLVEKTAKAYGAIAAKKSIALKTIIPPDLPAVCADASRISQVLGNLLDNAVKFSPPKSTIHVDARVLESDPHFVCVSVTDCGCGVKAEDADRIFERLYQAKDPLETSRQGLGLGLHICKELIALHGGNIWMDSKCGTGSAFRFTLPVFTIKTLIAPLVANEACLAPSIAFVTIRVTPDRLWRSERERERALNRVRGVLERCMLPDLDALLPPESWDRTDLFSIVARTDERGCQAILSRVREQLARCHDLEKAGIQWQVEGEVIDLGSLTKEMSLDRRTVCASEYLRDRLHKIKMEGESIGQQKNSSH